MLKRRIGIAVSVFPSPFYLLTNNPKQVLLFQKFWHRSKVVASIASATQYPKAVIPANAASTIRINR